MKQLSIDLRKEPLDLTRLSSEEPVEELQLTISSQPIILPLELNNYPHLVRISLYCKDHSQRYPFPENLDQLIHIRSLFLGSYCDLQTIRPMPQLTELDLMAGSTPDSLCHIHVLFPQVKKLDLWGRTLPTDQQAKDISQLAYLESLTWTGLQDEMIALPVSWASMKKLRSLTLADISLNPFPEVITQIENLEYLKIHSLVVQLPESLKNLTRLKSLNLDSALNGGTWAVAGASKPENLHLDPIPDIIGKLVNLEELNLDQCGVYDLAPLRSLKNLRKLRIVYSALTHCDELAHFSQLEDLSLNNSYNLQNLDGLRNLPIRYLNIASCDGLKSLDVLHHLPQLQRLVMNRCENIKDLAPLYLHPALQHLEADPFTLAAWTKRNVYATLPSVKATIAQLATPDLAVFEQAIEWLKTHVGMNYQPESTLLADYLGVSIEDEETVTELPVLDQALETYLHVMSNKALLDVFEMSFKDVYDNYQAALLVVQELIRRKKAQPQQELIKLFYKACEYYDAGHRYWGDTVQDQLIDTYFGQFESEALYDLFKDASGDMLNSNGGDAMDELFRPALLQTTDEALQNQLLDCLFAYKKMFQEEYDYDISYFMNIISPIEKQASDYLRKQIQARL